MALRRLISMKAKKGPCKRKCSNRNYWVILRPTPSAYRINRRTCKFTCNMKAIFFFTFVQRQYLVYKFIECRATNIYCIYQMTYLCRKPLNTPIPPTHTYTYLHPLKRMVNKKERCVSSDPLLTAMEPKETGK